MAYGADSAAAAELGLLEALLDGEEDVLALGQLGDPGLPFLKLDLVRQRDGDVYGALVVLCGQAHDFQVVEANVVDNQLLGQRLGLRLVLRR